MAKGFHSFDNTNFNYAPARNGMGKIHSAKLISPDTGDQYTFGYMIIPPGHSVGDHHHELTDEETYIIIEGVGEMTLDDETRTVHAGDLIINAPGGKHGLKNIGTTNLKVVAVDVPV